MGTGLSTVNTVLTIAIGHSVPRIKIFSLRQCNRFSCKASNVYFTDRWESVNCLGRDLTTTGLQILAIEQTAMYFFYTFSTYKVSYETRSRLFVFFLTQF